MRFRPSKWVLYAPVAALPLLAALFINGRTVHQDLVDRAASALMKGGDGWASLTVEGRDATISGEAPSAEAVDQAVKIVAGIHGIRLVESATRVVPPPPPPPPPD